MTTKTFTFKYDPQSSFDRTFVDFWDAVDGKLYSAEPDVISSNSIEVLSTNINANRLELFAALVKKKPANLMELARLLKRDYKNVWMEARILEGIGLIKLQKNTHGVKPIALYQRIIFDFPIEERVSSKKKDLGAISQLSLS